jgi:hypothetical protein
VPWFDERAQDGVAPPELQLVLAHAEGRVVCVREPGCDLIRVQGVLARDRFGAAYVAELVANVDAVGVGALAVVDGRQLDLGALGKPGDELGRVDPIEVR